MDWVEENEKFALIGLEASVSREIDRIELSDGLIAFTSPRLEIPELWRNWLGELRVEDIGNCNLFLLTKLHSNTPGTDDAEDIQLQKRINHWFMGLTLCCKYTAFDDPFFVVGSRNKGEIDLRTYGVLNRPDGSIVAEKEIRQNHLQNSCDIGRSLEAFDILAGQTDHWRLARCLEIYRSARSETDVPNRIHQFTRCLEGLIVPVQGKTRRQFINRTELFVGPRYHDLMGELYDARSDFEHLHEDRYLQKFDRETRIRLAKLEAVGEWVARSCLTRILTDANVKAHFGSVNSLNKFWEMSDNDRREIWGPPVDPCKMLRGYNFSHVNDAELGARE